MNKVLLVAEQLGEAILGSEQYIAMRLAEQAVINNEEAQMLIQTYSELKDAFQAELSKKPLDQEAITKAGDAVKETEAKLTANELINVMRDKSAAYSDMMQEINAVMSRVINGEPEECGSCSCDSCESCGGSCH